MGKGTIIIARELRDDDRFMAALKEFFTSIEQIQENHFSFMYKVEHPNILEYRNYEIIGKQLEGDEVTFELI